MKQIEDKIIEIFFGKYQTGLKEMFKNQKITCEYQKLCELEGKCLDIIDEMRMSEDEAIQADILAEAIKTSKSFIRNRSKYMFFQGVQLGLNLKREMQKKQRRKLLSARKRGSGAAFLSRFEGDSKEGGKPLCCFAWKT